MPKKWGGRRSQNVIDLRDHKVTRADVEAYARGVVSPAMDKHLQSHIDQAQAINPEDKAAARMQGELDLKKRIMATEARIAARKGI